LIISTWLQCLVLRLRSGNLHHALRGARHRTHDDRLQRLCGIAKRAPKHRHIDPGDDSHLRAIAEPLSDVARRRPEDISENQSLGVAHSLQQFTRLCFDDFDRRLGRDIERFQDPRTLGKRMLRHRLQ
jgi:hypothetical protein